MHLIGWLSLPRLAVFFSGALKCSVIWAIIFSFFLSWHICYLKGRSLRCSPGQGNAGRCAVMLYVGEGPRGSIGARFTLLRTSIFPLSTIKLGSSGAGSRVGGLVHPPRPLWVSPTTSPVRLGVSPDAAPTPTGIFNQRFEALFPCAGALGCAVCFAPPPFVWFICARMWGHGVPPTALPAPFSTTLSPALLVYLCVNVGSQGCLLYTSDAADEHRDV